METKSIIAGLKLQLKGFAKWLLLGALMGLLGGVIGAVFHICVDFVTEFRMENPLVLWLLPAGGIVIALIYKLSRVQIGANEVLDAIHTPQGLPLKTLPVIFVSTVITQLVGGSAGKEGAAIQMGGTIGYQLGKLFKLDEKDSHVAVMCGLSAVFAAVFGTPVTAAVFAIEVVSVGSMYYVALLPCIAAVVTAQRISILLGIKPLGYALAIPGFSIMGILCAVTVGVVCALISIAFCIGLGKGPKLTAECFSKLGSKAGKLGAVLKNSCFKSAVGGFIIIGMTYLVGNTDYNGAGFNLIQAAMEGRTVPYAFILKMLFTVVTISFGFKGGEIVPTMAIGALAGAAVAGIFVAEAGFFAGLGLIAMFCGMVNCPLASVLLGVELFGSAGLIYYAIVCAISFLLSGNYGLYSSQKLVYSKIKAEFINLNVRH